MTRLRNGLSPITLMCSNYSVNKILRANHTVNRSHMFADTSNCLLVRITACRKVEIAQLSLTKTAHGL